MNVYCFNGSGGRAGFEAWDAPLLFLSLSFFFGLSEDVASACTTDSIVAFFGRFTAPDSDFVLPDETLLAAFAFFAGSGADGVGGVAATWEGAAASAEALTAGAACTAATSACTAATSDDAATTEGFGFFAVLALVALVAVLALAVALGLDLAGRERRLRVRSLRARDAFGALRATLALALARRRFAFFAPAAARLRRATFAFFLAAVFLALDGRRTATLRVFLAFFLRRAATVVFLEVLAPPTRRRFAAGLARLRAATRTGFRATRFFFARVERFALALTGLVLDFGDLRFFSALLLEASVRLRGFFALRLWERVDRAGMVR